MESASFYEQVYQVVMLIPKGRVTSYGAIAEYLGAKKSSRMVGWAMNAANQSKIPNLPTHRVVNRNGMLSGRTHFETPTIMEERLLEEGILVADNTIRNLEKVFWNPVIELMI